MPMQKHVGVRLTVARFIVSAVAAFVGGGTMFVGVSDPATGQMREDMKPGMQGEMKPGMKMEMATEGIFEGRGEIIALLPQQAKLVVGHEEIPGFMEAMPAGMGYDVETADLLQGLAVGDPVTFKIDAAKKKIIAIERAP